MAVSTSSSRSAAMPMIKELWAPGMGMSETLPSAPAVVLPMTTAPGAVRKAMVVYSAWLWVTSSMRITTLPV